MDSPKPNMITSWTAEHAQANMNSPTWAKHGQPSIDSRTSNCFGFPDKAAARSYIHTFNHSYIHTYIQSFKSQSADQQVIHIY